MTIIPWLTIPWLTIISLTATVDLLIIVTVLHLPSTSTFMIKTEYAVDLESENCVSEVERALQAVPGIQTFSIDIKHQSLLVTGDAAPSAITRAVRKDAGKAILLRGTGDTNGAAVCILDTQQGPQQDVRGLVRMVGLQDGGCFIDLTVANYKYGIYNVAIHKGGDLSRGIQSAGQVYREIGTVAVDSTGEGELVVEATNIKIADVVGKSIVMGELAGVIARSAGVWENTKRVCACSGREIWAEHQSVMGML